MKLEDFKKTQPLGTLLVWTFEIHLKESNKPVEFQAIAFSMQDAWLQAAVKANTFSVPPQKIQLVSKEELE